MIHLMKRVAAASVLLAGTATMAQETGATLTGEAAFGGWRDDRPGVRRHFTPQDLPAPFATESTSNSARRVSPPEDVSPQLPQGFFAHMIASGLGGPRIVRVAPNGDIFVAESGADQVSVYRLEDGSAKPAQNSVFAGGLNQPYGIAFHPADDPQWVYVANTDSVVRFPYKSGDLEASSEPEVIVAELPSGGHWTRDLAFSPDGETLYVSVGSQSNVASGMGEAPGGLDAWRSAQPTGAGWGSETDRAAVLAFDADGANQRIAATGLRNCSGLALQPATNALWCAVNERDGLGDNLPFDYATSVSEGAFYGWPWYYIGSHEDPRHAGSRPDLADKVTVPDVLIQAHSAPLGITFYEGDQFPADYRGDAFVALHGSWNRGLITGYKVVRLLFDNGRPTGAYEDFMTGFVLSDGSVWGRPVGVAIASDGALIVSEDGSGTLWRIAYQGSR